MPPASPPPTLEGDDYRLLVESVVDYGIVRVDEVGRITTWNRGASIILGYSPSEVLGHDFAQLFTSEDLAAGKPELELELARRLGRFDGEGWRRRRDGVAIWVSVSTTALRDEEGNLRGFAEVTRDLSARKHAEEELRLADQRFHQLVESVVDYAIFMLDEAGHVSTWNAGARRVKGYPAEEIVGQHFSRFYTPEDQADGRPAKLLDIVRREGRVEDEGWRVRKDGSRFWANVVISARRNAEGKVIGFAKVTRDLSERRRKDDALRVSEERFRLLVENIGDNAIYMLDPDGRVTTWNRGAERMTGYAAVDIVGQSHMRFFPPEDVAAGRPSRELSIARTLGRFEDEGWRVRKDGSRFWANTIVTALHDSHRAHIGFAKITRDLTARREVEEKDRRLIREQAAREVAEEGERRLRESEARYRALSHRLEIVFEGVADGITVQDKSGRVVFANTAAAKICGFASGLEMTRATPETILARYETSDADGRPLAPEELPSRRVFSGEPTASKLVQIRAQEGRRAFWVLLRASAVLDALGQPELAIDIWHDVTAEHRQETQRKLLGEATAAIGGSLVPEEMLTTLARALVPGFGDWCTIFVVDRDDLREATVAEADAAAVAAAEYRRRCGPDPGQGSEGPIWSVVRRGISWRDDNVLLVPIRVRSRILGAIALVAVARDRRFDTSDVALAEEVGRRTGVALENAELYLASQDAARSAAEAARTAEDAARSAEEASRAKDEFLATVSHELRTPLSAILGWATLLKDRVDDPATLRPLEIIHRNAQAQGKIIDDILDVSRVITGKFRLDPRPCDLVSIAREAIEVVRPSADANKITISFVPRAEYCLLVADPERIQQAIWNLLSNAVKFTDPGGAIRISTEDDGSQVRLEVADTGRGIDPTFLPVVFERFKQADSSTTRRVGGLGLGLALVRHIVELHGGRVTAASAGLGQGAAFTIALPVRAVVSTSPELPPPARPSSDRDGDCVAAPSRPRSVLDGARVLVVDDEEDARDLVAAVLARAGAEVETARSAAEGFETFCRFRPDVLVSDIGMPGEDGLSFIRRIRALPSTEGGRIPALALTAFTRDEDRNKALGAGYTTHIGKPVEPAVLAAAVANLSEVPERSS